MSRLLRALELLAALILARACMRLAAEVSGPGRPPSTVLDWKEDTDV